MTVEAPGHDDDHGPLDHRGVMLCSSLIVTYGSPAAIDPGKRPLYHPPAGQDLEPDLPRQFGHHLDHQPQCGTERDRSTTVGAVDPDHTDPPEAGSQGPEQGP